jgi:hypothetical protein
MNQGTQEYCLPKKTEGRKSRETVPLRNIKRFQKVRKCFHAVRRCTLARGFFRRIFGKKFINKKMVY